MRYSDVVTMSRGTHGKEQTGGGGQATGASGSAAARWQEPAGSGPLGRCTAANGVPLARCAQRWRHRRAARYEQGRAARPAGAAELSRLYVALLEGATAHGFGTALWTLKRVRQLIEREYGVRYSEVHVWRLLGRWASAPEARATRHRTRRGGGRHWRKRTWPALKKKPPRRTTDRLHRRVRPERAAHAGAHLGAQGPDADHPVPLQLDAHLRHRRPDPHELHVPSARRLDQERAARRVPQGAARALEATAADHLGRPEGRIAASSCASTWTPPMAPIQMAFLPPYSPDLNPVEYLWAWLKRHALANFCPANLDELNTPPATSSRAAQRRTLDHRRVLGPGWAVVMSQIYVKINSCMGTPRWSPCSSR